MFLDVQGVEATNNIAERAHRFGVLWRKRSQGTWSEKGNRWVERVLSLRHPCRIRGRPTLPIFVEAVSCLCKGEVADLSWITQHEPLPTPSTLCSITIGEYRLQSSQIVCFELQEISALIPTIHCDPVVASTSVEDDP